MQIMDNTIKIGILGASSIAQKAIIEPSKKISDVILYGIAARDENRAKKYATENFIEKTYSDYHELINDSDINAVYIATANHLHKQYIIESVKNRKHVLVEKPLCLNKLEFDEINNALKQNNYLVQEALMVVHHPWQSAISNMIKKNTYGQLRYTDTKITFQLKKDKNNYRYFPDKGGGVFNDVSCYWLQLLQLCDLNIPINTESYYNFDKDNHIDREFESKLVFSNGVMSHFWASFNQSFQAKHSLGFENAQVNIKNFLKPAYGKIRMSIEIIHEEHREKIIFDAENYYENQLLHFLSNIRENNYGIDEAIGRRISLSDYIFKNSMDRSQITEGWQI